MNKDNIYELKSTSGKIFKKIFLFSIDVLSKCIHLIESTISS